MQSGTSEDEDPAAAWFVGGRIRAVQGDRNDLIVYRFCQIGMEEVGGEQGR